jgi:hypothetical protein
MNNKIKRGILGETENLYHGLAQPRAWFSSSLGSGFLHPHEMTKKFGLWAHSSAVPSLPQPLDCHWPL